MDEVLIGSSVTFDDESGLWVKWSPIAGEYMIALYETGPFWTPGQSNTVAMQAIDRVSQTAE